MAEVDLIKRDGRWGTSSFTDGVRFSPKASSEKRLPGQETPPAYSEDLQEYLVSLIKEGKFREVYRTIGNRFPDLKNPSPRA